jgi:hypothetical protein
LSGHSKTEAIKGERAIKSELRYGDFGCNNEGLEIGYDEGLEGEWEIIVYTDVDV